MYKDTVHIESVLGAEILVAESGVIAIDHWSDCTHPCSPAARDLAHAVGIEA
ncbi:hypothetical protein HLRTI_002159 [Halorhabdus tiamatea SARL4B]|uniref:Uncharacterized protein n=1 Tax=Halorhabdus tiamatea SARL4B TaxID=1033806 RepID=F7PJE9_9EURY|nr:hypothetical protein [Halorhabdus tiamatea]ERJ05771.1 hypothetical protein HLRTI_002159 [Halorhabdus tiamatea SARL4B]CCQ34295.1 hypothetical protein HTIA_2183 [Halorhabdus tiamatea SARL4B]